LLYGSDSVAFANLPATVGLPKGRADDCVAEYARANEVAEWLLAEYGRRPGDPPGATTQIVYEAPPTRVSATVLRELRRIDLLERVTERLHQRFTLERPFRLVMRSCGRPEAAWVADRRELAICYELVDTLYLLGLHAEDSDADDNRPQWP
jgi:hypothetical protein